MNNIVGNAASPALVASKLSKALYAPLFRQVYGSSAFSGTPQQVVAMLTDAVAAFESTPAVSPFNSRYDAYLAGKVVLTASELNGLRMFTGSTTGRPGGPAFTPSAQCFRCHSIPAVAGASTDLFTSFAYFNTGVPKNPNNPYYTETNARTNPLGYNPLGAAYIDLGLGDYLYPARGLPVGNAGAGSNGLGDFLASNGTFKTPTLRNVDKRPAPGFVKAYGHNGVFKSLQDVVHFYNVRNLTSKPGEVIDFTRANPYAGLAGTPLFAAPEYPSAVTLINSTGKPGQIGNLGLTPQQEADLIAFLQTLSDS
jgi:cytochrome c peroxidase